MGSSRELAGTVQAAGQPISGTTVTLFAAGTAAPARLAEDRRSGRVQAGCQPVTGDSVLYIVAKGRTPKVAANKGPNDAIALLVVLSSTPPQNCHGERIHHVGVGVNLGAIPGD